MHLLPASWISGLRRPGAKKRSVVFPSNATFCLPASRYCGHLRPDVTHPIRHPGRTPQPSDSGWLVEHSRHDRDLRRWWWPAAGSIVLHPAVPGSTVSPAAAERGPRTTTRATSLPRQARLVAGGAISALEIAAELAQLSAARVVVTQRHSGTCCRNSPRSAVRLRISRAVRTSANETLPPARST